MGLFWVLRADGKIPRLNSKGWLYFPVNFQAARGAYTRQDRRKHRTSGDELSPLNCPHLWANVYLYLAEAFIFSSTFSVWAT
ncbi:hypothetical protein AB1N83_007802 [Pleurotus pulmonarius]